MLTVNSLLMLVFTSAQEQAYGISTRRMNTFRSCAYVTFVSSEKEDEISLSISSRRSTMNFVDTALASVFMLMFWGSQLLLDRLWHLLMRH